MTKKTWDQHSIKGELHRRGMTLTALAELHDMTPGHFSHVWKRPVRKAEQAIADFLGVAVEELFPARYPIRRSRILSSSNEALLKSQKAGSQADKAGASTDRRAA
ncbi:helix-turn-helix domain-containing protein [Roseibium litorale]|uniref:Helix-turn-helix domain-containing protein n=1 Tax=Roseibium litorale TaxID=2803841 RepID=A0ABR9CHK8_9HYPH|nr:helix-turn-helix transcriptional regulator [Roseibium litorale]MBD8890184.1 helix-turn-helix domain-containing protein [Roseibium litorale]